MAEDTTKRRRECKAEEDDLVINYKLWRQVDGDRQLQTMEIVMKFGAGIKELGDQIEEVMDELLEQRSKTPEITFEANFDYLRLAGV